MVSFRLRPFYCLGKSSRYLLIYGRLGGFQSRSGCFGRLGGFQSQSGCFGAYKSFFLPFPGIEPRFLERPVHSPVTMLSELSSLPKGYRAEYSNLKIIYTQVPFFLNTLQRTTNVNLGLGHIM